MNCALPIMLWVSLCLTATACGLPEGNPPLSTENPQKTKPDSLPRELHKPMLMPIAATTCADSVPIHGIAEGGGTVIVQGGLSSATQDANPSTGQFCLDVPLRSGTVNRLEVQVSDPKLGLSESSLVNVEQVDCETAEKPAPQVTAETSNVILGAHPFSNMMPSSGDAAALTDGDPETSATYNGRGIWIVFKLEELTTLDKIVIRWREWLDQGDEQFGTAYTLFGSNKAEPGDPVFLTDEYYITWKLDNDNWFIIDEIDNGTGCLSNTCGMDVLDLDEQPVVRYVGMLMKTSGALWSPKYALSELEIWDKPKKSGSSYPSEMTLTCATLDSSS